MSEAALIGADARARLDPIVEDLLERQRREVPELWATDAPAFDDAVARSTRDSVGLIVAMLMRPSAPPRELPAGARLEASVAAQYGARPEALLRTYRLGQQALIEHFLDAIERGAVGDPAHAIGQLRAATRVVHAYTDALVPMVSREYSDERDRLEAWPELRRLRLVQAALAGDGTSVLGYDLAGKHVALASAGDGVEQAVESVARPLEAPYLVVRTADEGAWAWIATARLADVRERLRAQAGVAPTGLGGPAGFGEAHRQALLTERIAQRRGDRIVDLHGAAFEALALGDGQTARELARAELGPLVGGDKRHEQLRATLEAWFSSRESPAAAAAALGVAPRTVSYRLRRAEQLLGHPIADRRAELEVALRLERLFAGDPPPAGR